MLRSIPYSHRPLHSTLAYSSRVVVPSSSFLHYGPVDCAVPVVLYLDMGTCCRIFSPYSVAPVELFDFLIHSNYSLISSQTEVKSSYNGNKTLQKTLAASSSASDGSDRFQLLTENSTTSTDYYYERRLDNTRRKSVRFRNPKASTQKTKGSQAGEG